MKLLATAAIISFTANAANAAAMVKFVLTGEYEATWTRLATSEVTTDFGNGFEIKNVAGTWAGSPGFRDLYFSTAANGGRFYISTEPEPFTVDAEFIGAGDQLFTGTTEKPTFRTGVFTLTAAEPGFLGNGTLTVSNAVPEPASWAMLIAGFGLTGATMRRRRVAVVNA